VEQWFKVVGHISKGKGGFTDYVLFMYAETPVDAFARYMKMLGVRAGKAPDVTPLTEDQASELERRINDEEIPLSIARKSCYSPP